MIRVNHAGELGAQTIYEGQMKIFKGTPLESTIQVRFKTNFIIPFCLFLLFEDN